MAKERRTGPGGPLDPIERASRDEIAALQLSRLRATLERAYANVPHYRRSFDEAGVRPDDLRELADLAKFPFLTKADLRDNYPFGLFATPRTEVVRVHASSGTTGRPTVVGYTRRDLDAWADVMARSIRAAGGRPGDVAHVAYGYGLFTGGLGAHDGAQRLGCTVIPMSGGATERQVQLIRDFGAQIILVTPSYMLAIAEEFARQGLDPRDCDLLVGIHGAEPWTDAMRAGIERAFDMDALDIYGISEVMGPGVAQECIETKDGPTVWEDHFYPEIVDPETGHPLADGAHGELVWTSLTKEAFPVVRYRSRDLTRLLPPTARSFRRIERVTGRSDDMLIIRGVNVFPSQIEEVLVADRRLAPHYLLEVRRPQTLDELTVRVEAAAAFADAGDQAQRACADELARRIKGVVGVTADVRIAKPGEIERSQGKAKRVSDLRPK